MKKVVNNYFVGTKKEQEFNDFYSFFFCIEQKVHPHVHLHWTKSPSPCSRPHVHMLNTQEESTFSIEKVLSVTTIANWWYSHQLKIPPCNLATLTNFLCHLIPSWGDMTSARAWQQKQLVAWLVHVLCAVLWLFASWKWTWQCLHWTTW